MSWAVAEWFDFLLRKRDAFADLATEMLVANRLDAAIEWADRWELCAWRIRALAGRA